METSAPSLRQQLLGTARKAIEESGPEAVRARSLTAQVGTSTQSLYTHFGGMPGLIDALVADAFDEFAQFVAAVPESDDPVADFFTKGWAYSEWALAHHQLYRLMFGLSGGELKRHAGLEMALSGSMANSPQAQRSVDVLVDSMRRVTESGRIDPIDPAFAARQFLSATHGYVLLQAGGVFGVAEESLGLLGGLAVNLMVGLGDAPEQAAASLAAAISRRQDQ
jgi:AcrR family transcriptional regulator